MYTSGCTPGRGPPGGGRDRLSICWRRLRGESVCGEVRRAPGGEGGKGRYCIRGDIKGGGGEGRQADSASVA